MPSVVTGESVDCWSGGWTAEICCNLETSPRGDNRCWAGQFTFENCCSQRYPVQAGGTNIDCFQGGWSANFCCDTSVSSRGRQECWDGQYTFEACCAAADAALVSAPVAGRSEHAPELTLSTTAITSEVAEHVFDRSCWTGDPTERQALKSQRYCCDLNVSAFGRKECWDTSFTYERCCKLWQPQPMAAEATLTSTTIVAGRPEHTPELTLSTTTMTTEVAAVVFDKSCWTGDSFERDALESQAYCCDLNVSPFGRAQCWDKSFTYERCCKPRQSPPLDRSCWGGLLGDSYRWCCGREWSYTGSTECWDDLRWRVRVHKDQFPDALLYENCCVSCWSVIEACPVCKRLRDSSVFGHWERDQCTAARGLIVAERRPSWGTSRAMCAPDTQLCHASELQSFLGHTAAFPMLDIKSCSRRRWTAQEMFCFSLVVLPAVLFFCRFLVCKLFFILKTCSGPMIGAHTPSQRGRHASIDALRVLATVSTLVFHLNQYPLDGTPRHLATVDRLARWQDIFTVISAVLLACEKSCSMGQALDKVWRKLIRQLPVFLIPINAIIHGVCAHPRVCSSLWRESWMDLVRKICFRWSYPPDGTWPFACDLRIYLVLLAHLVVRHQLGPRTFAAFSVIIMSGCAPKVGHVPSLWYYSISSYRLPMALLVFHIARLPRLFTITGRPWLQFAIVALLLTAGMSGPVDDIPSHATWKLSRCYELGWCFFGTGLAFHLGLLALCMFPAVGTQIRPVPSWMTESCFATLVLHQIIVGTSRMCVPEQTIWFFQSSIRGTQFLPRWAPCPWWFDPARLAVTLIICIFVGGVAVVVVQRPWERLLRGTPAAPRHVVAMAYVALVLWECYIVPPQFL